MEKGRCCGHIDGDWGLLDPITSNAAAASSFEQIDCFYGINLLL